MTQQHPSPIDFYSTFQNVVTAEAPGLIQCWTLPGEFTTMMLSRIFPRVAGQMGLKCYSRDYYTLDSVFYHEKDEKHFWPEATYVKYISVAIEHENTPGGTAAEMNKLQLFSSPLKVLVMYPTGSQPAAKLLAEYEDIIADADVFDDIGTLRRQLVLFGFLVEGVPRWEAYAYEPHQFVRLQEGELKASA